MGILNDRSFAAALLCLLFSSPFWFACSDGDFHSGHGIVHEVSRADKQILIEHDEIPGLMPAMTMTFAVYDPKLLESLKPGDVIDFELQSERGSSWISAVTVVGQVQPEDGWSLMGDGLVQSDPAPPFAFADSNGEIVSLAGLAGKTLLVDFIFTRCPGPCPTLTSTHVAVQRALSPEQRERIHFVSISIDPERDTHEDLLAYGQARGADPSGWSFLTGPPTEVAEVVRAYGVGTVPGKGGEIEHVVATFLVDPRGRIVKRYIGLDHEPDEIVADLRAVAFPSG
jgi:protein SCO1/2